MIMSQKERELDKLKTSFWCNSRPEALRLLVKMNAVSAKLIGYVENNLVILNHDLTKTQYKRVFSSKA